jgi:hypothetical protein
MNHPNPTKLAALQRWAEAMTKADQMMGPIIDLLDLRPEGPVTTALWLTQDALTAATADIVEDEAQWLQWHHADNEMGAKAMEAGPKGDMRPIKTLEDLLWVIGVAA